ncbi:tRNA (adenine(22)-N(1))-methyltransferase [Candidatus Contubernalis alkaliaceticus]|uniref:tRNA (adenine(22)-N(1))-methyltransferase n=1 Tax=Candidatus Contubernalis alkaliaceticus TaxID=338645 RepID=UPI001F4C2FDF|nr:class I SAM-dependent methyltransferase [Candidatus Contubernalis alkalaceticus]UNC92983.1 SAM-dependent methyltransferase [Candidatus Contubernalis alkalaceticus]
MKLTPRLQTIADSVPGGCTVADIGTDHGYLPVYLVEEKNSPYVIAGDVNEKPLAKAGQLVHSLNLQEIISVRLGDGLKIIELEDRVEVIIIAGMGGKTVCGILEESPEITAGIKMLVLQPMVNIPHVRFWLGENNFAIIDEKIAQEGKHFYVIIMAVPGEGEQLDDVQLELGPRLLEKKDVDPLFKAFFEHKMRKYNTVLESLKGSRQEIEPQKYNYWIRLVNRIQEELKCI